MQQQFTPEQKNLLDIFSNDTTYIIPQYQRPYSWDCIGKSDKNNQVNVMWQDLIDFFKNDTSNIYFMGSMVVVGDAVQREFEVIDGQQRLTTISLLLSAMNCFISGLSKSELDETQNTAESNISDLIKQLASGISDLIYNPKRIGALIRENKLKIARLNPEFDYNEVFKLAMACNNLDNNKAIKDIQAKANQEQEAVLSRYFANRDYFVRQLKSEFMQNGVFTIAELFRLNDFIEFLRRRVNIIRIISASKNVAFQIFEILNNRGLPLTNKDLFRNFIISKFEELKISNPQKYEKLESTEKWQHLEKEYRLDNEFISRYVESKKGAKQQFSAFNDITKDIYERTPATFSKSQIEVFYEDIEYNLDIYDSIVNLEFENPHINSRVAFLINSGNTSYVINLLMALFRNTKNDKNATNIILDFLKLFELYTLFMLIGSPRFKFATIFDAIKKLNDKDFAAAAEYFVLKVEERAELPELLGKPIEDNNTAKLIIARYHWALANKTYTQQNTTVDTVNGTLNFSVASLEHIIPQKPAKDTNWLRDFTNHFRKEFTYKLGNMVLLSKSLNSQAKNSSWEKKKTLYAQTQLAMVAKLTDPSLAMSPTLIMRRHQEIIQILRDDLEI